MQHKRQKASRYRASKTHGCGSMKKRRGKGNKGGAGNAGSGKRADQKKPSFWKYETGRIGFISKTRNYVNAITFFDVQKLIKKGTLKEENGIYDLDKFGYNKLLSKGKVSKIKIKVSKASKKIVEAIKKVGGEVILEAKVQKKAVETKIPEDKKSSKEVKQK
jgi:large subunit ribosomal protein L15|tara:strand:- start:478 stop:963 length:486 start_codon:yes stop_codon:yes gene_type:complete